MKTRVLLVIDEMEVGGTQRQMVHLVRGIDRDRFEVEVAYFRFTSFLVDELLAMGVKAHEVPKRGRIDPGFSLALRRLVAEGRFDLVHAFSFSSELWTCVALATLAPARRPRLISSIRGTYEWYGPSQWQIKRWVTRHSWAVVSNSRQAARYAAERMGIDASRIEVIYNGLPARAPLAADAAQRAAGRERLRASLGVETGAMLLLFVGRLVDHKNLPTLLQAMKQVPLLGGAGVRPVHLVLAGDGPDRDPLERQTDALQLRDRVQWLGERRDVADLMDASDVVVLPSWREGLSNVILEAMQAGRAVIASRAGGNVESVLPGVTGLLFDPADSDALASAIVRLAANAPLAERLGRAGRERMVSTFALENMAGRMQRCYDAVLAATNDKDLVHEC